MSPPQIFRVVCFSRLWMLSACLLSPCFSVAQLQQQARTLNSSGGAASNAHFVIHTSTSQNQAVGTAQSSALRAHMGFLKSLIIPPAGDADGDGVANENDPDDDGDRLSDVAEIAGTAFSPTTITDPLRDDSDGDGMLDGDESVAGTNPLDPNARLAISGFQHHRNALALTWLGRAGREYDVVAASEISKLNRSTQVLARVTGSGGSAPWFATSVSSTNLPIHHRDVLRIRVRTP